jgi:hypothetical protein
MMPRRFKSKNKTQITTNASAKPLRIDYNVRQTLLSTAVFCWITNKMLSALACGWAGMTFSFYF